MRGDHVVTRFPRVFDESDPYQNKVVWTHNGDYIATLYNVTIHQADHPEEKILYANARTGALEVIPCPGCMDLAPVGDRALIALVPRSASDGGDQFLRIDLNSGRSSAKFNVPNVGSFLSSTHDFILTKRFVRNGEQLDLVKPDGTHDKDIGYFRSNEYVLSAAREDGNSRWQMALALQPNPAECVAAYPVVILNADGSIT